MELSSIRIVAVISLMIAVTISNAGCISMVNAQKETNDNFKVIVTLSGITGKTKDILILVNVGDQTRSKLFNAEDPKIKGSDKVNYTLTFPGQSIDENEKYTVCVMSIKNFKLECDNAHNSSQERPEFVDINLSAKDSTKEKEHKVDKAT